MKRITTILLTLILLVVVGVTQTVAGLKAGDKDPATGKKIKYWAAPMDPTYIRNEPGKSPMGMDLIPVFEEAEGEKLPASTILIDAATIQNMGVRTAPVRSAALSKSIRALGTVTYDETKIFAVNVKFDGWIEQLYVNFVGESVKKGQPLFSIYSPELVTAQEEFLLAVQQVQSLGSSPYESVRRNAETLLKASTQRLRYWDLEEAQIARLKKAGTVQKATAVYSPASGVIIKKEALQGHLVKAGMHQYEIADLSKVWVDVEVYEYELPFVKKGMNVEMELSYLPGKRLQGEVLFVYPFLNPKTRTAKLRLAFDNKEGQLKPDMYANVFLESTITDNAILIPQEAVIDSGVRKMVFISRGEGKFEPREIKLGIEGADNTFQVLEGLKAGEEVVVSAQFMFDSESRLREAIQKMLEAKTLQSGGAGLEIDDLKMDGMDMSDVKDLDISSLKMD
ncbi:MAG: efflux RND transporter periplasmic adaptor subunit [Proteobacteria bacterium]|nr:efflux RND transporter periplasmic adaptor subunit [Pseudomonadota bacterium]